PFCEAARHAQELTVDAQTDGGGTGNEKCLEITHSALNPSEPCSKQKIKEQRGNSASNTSTSARRRWTLADKEKLLQAAESCRKAPGGLVAWPQVQQQHFPDRTAIASLPEIVRKHGERNWGAVAEDMAQVSGIRRHKGVYHSMWHLHLCPRMQTAPPWDAEKAARLKELAAYHGKDDVFLAYKFFPEYSPAALRVMLRRMDTKLAAVDYRVGKRSKKDSEPMDPR
ncbi:hypothetical protein GGI05_004503, partial [Coemansia sp. RSA 2603]